MFIAWLFFIAFMAFMLYIAFWGINKTIQRKNKTKNKPTDRVERDPVKKDPVTTFSFDSTEADNYISSYGAAVKALYSQIVILPQWGSERLAEHRKNCQYLNEHNNDWRSIPHFQDALKRKLVRQPTGLYYHPAFGDRVLFKSGSYQDIDDEFAKINADAERAWTQCLIAESKAYDISKLYSVVGVTFKNGRRHRQTILRQIKFHDSPYSSTPTFSLRRYEFEGEDAVGVYANDEQVGNISKTDLPWLIEHWEGYLRVDDYEISGGGDYNYGLTIRVCFKNT